MKFPEAFGRDEISNHYSCDIKVFYYHMTLSKQQLLIHCTNFPGIEPAIVLVHGYTCDETD